MYKANTWRNPSEYCAANYRMRSGYARKVETCGQRLGQLGAEIKPRLDKIKATFEFYKARVERWAYEELANVRVEKVYLDERYQGLSQTIIEKKSRLQIVEAPKLEYSLFQGLLLLFATMIFLLAEWDLTIQTVASSLGLNIDIELIKEEPGNLENYGGILLAAALGAVTIILDLWISHYVVVPYFQKDPRALVLFRWLLLPVGVLTFGLALANAILRWRFSEALFDPMATEIWRSLWTPSGEFSTYGLLFVIFLVISLQLCGALGLSFGQHHMRSCYQATRHKIQYIGANTKRFLVEHLSLRKLEEQRNRLAAQKRQAQDFIDGFEAYLDSLLLIIDRRCDEMQKLLHAAYEEGKRQAEHQAKEAKLRRPISQYIRQQLATDITGDDHTQISDVYRN